jgi:hypothetical protein
MDGMLTVECAEGNALAGFGEFLFEMVRIVGFRANVAS